jgi:hypothetical protein
MNKSLDRRQAAESDNPSTGVTQVPLQRIEPHLDPGCIVADADRAYAAYDFAAGISAH